MPYYFNPLIKEQFDYYEDSYIPVAEEAGYLKLDQTTPQTVTGEPTFDGGIKVINGFIILNE